MSPNRFPESEWTTSRLRLRPFKDSDAKALVDACNDPTIHYYLPHFPQPYTINDAHDFLERAAGSWQDGRAQWAITDIDTDDYLGSIGVPRTQPGFASCELGYLMAPWARNRGLASEAVASVTDFVFTYGIARCELHIALPNIASQRVALRAGYWRDGQLRSGIALRDGRRHERIIYSRLPGDPKGPTVRSLPDLPGGMLRDDRVVLRPLRPEDSAALFAHFGLAESWRTSVPPIPPSRESVDSLCRYRAADQWLSGVTARMVIIDAAAGSIAGSISLHLASSVPPEAMIGYGLNRAHRGRGLATRAVRLVSKWAFSTGISRVCAGTAEGNTQSQAVLRRAGFTREGVRRNILPNPDGGWANDILWSLLIDDA